MSKFELLSIEQLRFKIRRGMLELDIILTRFLDNGYNTLSDGQKYVFQQLLAYEDPELWAWFFSGKLPPTPELIDMVNCIKNA